MVHEFKYEKKITTMKCKALLVDWQKVKIKRPK